GLTYLELGLPEEAEGHFQLAIDSGTTNGRAHSGRGLARINNKPNYEVVRAAIEDAEKALSLGPKSQSLVYDAAQIYALAAERLADAATKGRPRDYEQLRSRYEGEAIKLLAQALNLTTPPTARWPFWRYKIWDAPTFKGLRIRRGADLYRLEPTA